MHMFLIYFQKHLHMVSFYEHSARILLEAKREILFAKDCRGEKFTTIGKHLVTNEIMVSFG